MKPIKVAEKNVLAFAKTHWRDVFKPVVDMAMEHRGDEYRAPDKYDAGTMPIFFGTIDRKSRKRIATIVLNGPREERWHFHGEVSEDASEMRWFECPTNRDAVVGCEWVKKHAYCFAKNGGVVSMNHDLIKPLLPVWTKRETDAKIASLKQRVEWLEGEKKRHDEESDRQRNTAREYDIAKMVYDIDEDLIKTIREGKANQYTIEKVLKLQRGVMYMPWPHPQLKV